MRKKKMKRTKQVYFSRQLYPSGFLGYNCLGIFCQHHMFVYLSL
uniref:Uncharacterized protein n=1 Tax=Manihot esculenta TaxID=3983 RepID=A0A199UAL4_MANES